MFKKMWSNTHVLARAATAALGTSGFGAAQRRLRAQGPKAVPSQQIGSRARRHRPETAAPARRRARPLAAGLWRTALTLPLGVFLCTAVLSVSPAQAQTAVDLVSNHSGPSPSETHTVGRLGVSDWQSVAQQFTTGDQSAGYRLLSVVAHIRSLGSQVVPKVSIHRSISGNRPGASLYVLTNPTTVTAFADNTFTAPANAELDANTKYFVVFENTGTRGAGTDHRYALRPTTSNSQAGESGWSIADNTRRRLTAIGDWDSIITNATKIAVRGHVKPSPATGQPGISGKPQVGIKLTALMGSIADRDGLPLYYPDDFTFQWVRIDSSDNETTISGATSHQYRLVAADEDHTIKVKVSFTDRADFSEGPLVSPATGTIAGWPTGTGVASADALVSNLSRNGDGDGNVGNILAQNFTQAIGFTTGSNRDGYELRSIRAVLDFADSSDGVRVRIFSSSGTTPDSSVATLTNPTIGDGAKEFSAPADTILDKDTLYFVVFDTTSSSGSYSVSVTNSDTTTTAAAGWSLNTQRHQKSSDSNWVTIATAVLVEVNGGAVLNSLPVFTDGASATRSIEENLGSATDTSARNVGDPVAATDADSGDTLTYSLEGTDAAKFDIDSSTGQIKTKVGQNYDHQGDGTLSVTVSVTDGLDTVSIPVTIYITDHPTPESPLAPAAPTVRGSGTESLAVSWGQPSNAGRPAISGYDLRYREGTSGSWIDGPQDVTETSAQLTGLVENTAYEAQVRAQNADGEGPWSPAGTGTTVASATRSIEENLGSDTDTSARNVGDPVAATDADSGDTLTYSLEGTDAAKFDIDSSTGQIKTKVGQNYDHEGDGTLSVTVSVTGGLDTVSIPVTIYITDHPTPEPPLAPAAPTVRGSGTESLEVSWGQPSNAGRPEIIDYDLRFREGTSGSWTDGPQDVTETSAQITGLVANTAYEVQVRAQNADGDGPWSPAGTGSTYHPGAPGGVLLETTLTTGPSSRQGAGCSSTSDYECADAMNPSNGFVSIDTNGVAKAFAIAGLQLDKVGNNPESYNFHIWFEGVRELRDYEVENLGVEVTVNGVVYRYWSNETPHGGYHLRHWRNVDMRWDLVNLGQMLPIRILDRRTFPDSNMAMIQQPLTAEFSDVPESHDGATAFTVRLAFSADVDIEPVEMRDHALTVTGGTVTGALRVDGRSDLWEFTVEPAGSQEVGILVPQGRACAEQGALCTSDGRALSGAVPGLGISYQQSTEMQQDAALTAAFENVPPEHDGSSGFTLELAFSVAVFDGNESVNKNQVIRDAVAVTGGTLSGASQTVQGTYDRWTLTVEPSGYDDVTVSLPATSGACSEAGAICTPGGTPLSGTATATVEGPSLPELSIADAEAQEGPNVFLRFKITLSEAFDDPVTFDIATSDGTAIAGTDYVAKNRSKTIRAGRTTAWFKIHVIDDAIDEGDETFTVTISNVTGATIADGAATGTIRNSDPMPRAWLARFGRTASIHVVDAVEERLQGGAPSESWVQLGGFHIGPGTSASETLSELSPDRRLWDEVQTDPEGYDMPVEELLLGSAFHLVSNPEDAGSRPRFSAWGRIATSGFEGREDRVSFDGTVTTATLGVDGRFERWLTGLAVAHSRGEGGYSMAGTDAADLEGTLTSLHPYAAWRASDRVTLWGLAGYGSGSLNLLRQGELAKELSTDLALTMGAVGVRGEVLSQPGGLTLAVRSDALWTQTSSQATSGLAATKADASRLRLILEGSRPVWFEDGGAFTPVLEVGVRHDGGDAETGSGVEVGARLGYASSWGLSLEVSLRALVAHEAENYEEWGVSGSLRYDPGTAGLGLTASVTPSWGPSSGGVGELWSRPDTRGLATEGALAQPVGWVDAELGYGVSTLRSRGVLTPYARVALSGEAGQAWHVGTRLSMRDSLDLSLEATRRQREGETAAHDLALLATVPW